jgi:hypothetical protein
MTVFNWIMGVLLAITGGLSVLCFVVYISAGIDLWLKRAKLLRHWAYMFALLWFNVWIWGTVVMIIINW